MHKYLICSFCFILCSCQVGKDYIPQKFILEQDIAKELSLKPKTQKIYTDWYKIFNDEDLNTLLSIALKNNLSVQQSTERLKQSRILLAIYSKEMFPMLGANGEYDYNKSNDVQNYSFNINSFKLGFDASWELDIWGRGKYITEKYYQLMQNQAYSLENITVTITAEVVNNYIALREAQEKLNIAKRNLVLQRDILQTVKDKHSAGIADDLALNQALFAVESTKATIPQYENKIESYKNAIAVLLGVLPQNLPINLDKYKKNITAYTFKFDTKKLYDLPLSIIRLRPDIMAAEASIIAQNAMVNEAITTLYPTLNLTGTFGFISKSGHNLFNKDSQLYGYTSGISVPIWHWGQLTNNIELQKHIKEEYILNYNEAMLIAISELKNAINAVEQSYQANKYNKTSLFNMRNIMNLTQQKYKNGLIEFTDVADAERNYLTAQNTLATSNAQILLSLTAFYKAVGGGYNMKDLPSCDDK